MQCVLINRRWDFKKMDISHMRNLFLNTFKSQGRVIDQNALLLPKPR